LSIGHIEQLPNADGFEVCL